MTKLLRRTGVVAVVLVAFVALAAPGANAVAAPNQTFDARMPFEGGPPGPDDCARGEFVARGVIDDRGPARLCARNFLRPRGDATGTQHFEGSTGHYVLRWKTRCGPFDERTETITCRGQWKMVRAPEGHGDVTHILHFGPGEDFVEAHYDGVVSCPQGRPGRAGPRGCPNGPQG